MQITVTIIWTSTLQTHIPPRGRSSFSLQVLYESLKPQRLWQEEADAWKYWSPKHQQHGANKQKQNKTERRGLKLPPLVFSLYCVVFSLSESAGQQRHEWFIEIKRSTHVGTRLICPNGFASTQEFTITKTAATQTQLKRTSENRLQSQGRAYSFFSQICFIFPQTFFFFFTFFLLPF